MERLTGQTDLLQVVGRLRAGRGFTHFLDGGNEQGDQNCDDGDDHQQLDQGKALPVRELTLTHANLHENNEEGTGETVPQRGSSKLNCARKTRNKCMTMSLGFSITCHLTLVFYDSKQKKAIFSHLIFHSQSVRRMRQPSAGRNSGIPQRKRYCSRHSWMRANTPESSAGKRSDGWART